MLFSIIAFFTISSCADKNSNAKTELLNNTWKLKGIIHSNDSTGTEDSDNFALAWFNVFLGNSKINFSKDSVVFKPSNDVNILKSLSNETESDAGPKTKKFPLHFDNKNKVNFDNTTYKIQMKNSEEIELIGEEFTLLLVKIRASADTKNSSNSRGK